MDVIPRNVTDDAGSYGATITFMDWILINVEPIKSFNPYTFYKVTSGIMGSFLIPVTLFAWRCYSRKFGSGRAAVERPPSRQATEHAATSARQERREEDPLFDLTENPPFVPRFLLGEK